MPDTLVAVPILVALSATTIAMLAAHLAAERRLAKRRSESFDPS